MFTPATTKRNQRRSPLAAQNYRLTDGRTVRSAIWRRQSTHRPPRACPLPTLDAGAAASRARDEHRPLLSKHCAPQRAAAPSGHRRGARCPRPGRRARAPPTPAARRRPRRSPRRAPPRLFRHLGRRARRRVAAVAAARTPARQRPRTGLVGVVGVRRIGGRAPVSKSSCDGRYGGDERRTLSRLISGVCHDVHRARVRANGRSEDCGTRAEAGRARRVRALEWRERTRPSQRRRCWLGSSVAEADGSDQRRASRRRPPGRADAEASALSAVATKSLTKS